MILTQEDRHALELLSIGEDDAFCRRARLLLAYAANKPTREAAAEAELSRGRARFWRLQFERKGMAIFHMPEGELVALAAPDASAAQANQIKKPEEAQKLPNPEDVFPLPPDRPEDNLLPFPTPIPRPGITANDSLTEAGRKTLLYLFAEMLSHEAGTRSGEDIEELHDMRVATRRLRAAFIVFADAFDQEAIQRYIKGLRATGRALGKARDLDVFMEKAHAYLATLTLESQPGLQPLLSAWETERVTARREMGLHLESEKYQRFKQAFNKFVQTPGAGILEIDSSLPVAHRVQDVVPVLIYSRLEAVRAYDSILPNATITQLHALRIEFKKLRYTVEYFKEALGEEAKEIINELKGMQDHLGDLHDADVACLIIQEFLEKWEAEQSMRPIVERRSAEPMVAYLAYQHAERHRLVASFPEAWANFNRPEFRQKLARTVGGL